MQSLDDAQSKFGAMSRSAVNCAICSEFKRQWKPGLHTRDLPCPFLLGCLEQGLTFTI